MYLLSSIAIPPHSCSEDYLLCRKNARKEGPLSVPFMFIATSINKWGFEKVNFPLISQENIEELARVEVHDTGKPLWEARFDIEGCADTIEFCAGLAPTVSGMHHNLESHSKP